MNILVIDGQGGKMGRKIIEELCSGCDGQNMQITAVGTNSCATESMIKGGAVRAATGENPLIVAAKQADIIIGPIGIVIADALYGEITPKMALAVAQSSARRILLPVNRCGNQIAGVRECTVNELIDDAMKMVNEIIKGASR